MVIEKEVNTMVDFPRLIEFLMTHVSLTFTLLTSQYLLLRLVILCVFNCVILGRTNFDGNVFHYLDLLFGN